MDSKYLKLAIGVLMDQVAIHSDLKKADTAKAKDDADYQRRLKQLQDFRGEQ